MERLRHFCPIKDRTSPLQNLYVKVDKELRVWGKWCGLCGVLRHGEGYYVDARQMFLGQTPSLGPIAPPPVLRRV